MAKRHASKRSLRGRWISLTVAALAGAGVGVALALDHFSSQAHVVPTPPAVARPVPRPSSPEPTPARAVIVLENEGLETAVQRALNQVGTIERSTSQPRASTIGSNEVRWSRRTLDVRLRGPARSALASIRAEVERAGGRVLDAGPTAVQIAVVRDDVTFVTHSIRMYGANVQGRVAVIFDDAGGSLPDVEDIVALGRPVTVAVLPGLRYSREVAARAQAAGLDVFLHLPVEPEDASKRMGPGGVTTAMSDEEIATTVRTDLAWVPGATGINNHMGSLGTADPRVMRAILTVAKERGLIFLDSMTTSRSVGMRVATVMRVPTAARDIFIDNENDAEAIRAQFRRLIALAKRKGVAVGIGHAQRITARVLEEMLPEFDREGIELIPGSALVH